MIMSNTIIWLTVIAVALFIVVVYCLFFIQKLYHKLELAQAAPKVDQAQLKLAALERLAVFAERSKINALITRTFQTHYSARDMQTTLINTIKEEYDYNISQQVYITPELWDAVSKMKEQNIYIINQVAASLPANANALDLNKNLLELTTANPAITMNTMVLDALQYETKNVR